MSSFKNFSKKLIKNCGRAIGISNLLATEVGKNNLGVRETWLKDTLTKIPSGSRILDAGAGQLQYKPYCSHLMYVSQDFGKYDGQGDGRGLQSSRWDQSGLDIVCDITKIPESDASFDAVMCIEVLEHLPDPVNAIRELVRLLKPSGHLIVTAPFCSLTHQAPYFFQTGYSRYFYEYWLNEFGLSIIDMQHNGNYFGYLAQEIRRLPTIARQYSNQTLNLYEEWSLRILLASLGRLSSAGQASDQLLSFGLHILAYKN